ncbi:hypothetical protein BROUX41_004727 [Berkeleyomyces rouxiae]
MTVKTKVQLVPYDAESETHRQRLYDQRVACGWGEESIDEWTRMQLSGDKTIFWVVLGEAVPEEAQKDMISKNMTRFPAESTLLRDSALTIDAAVRTPTNQPFFPMGHIAIQHALDTSAGLGLSPAEDFWWITSLYIAHDIQRGGFGRSAVDIVEDMLVQRGAKTIVIDTVSHEASQEDIWLRWRFENRGLEKPAVFKTNEQWYKERGYTRFGAEKKGYLISDRKTDEKFWAEKCFMRKDAV